MKVQLTISHNYVPTWGTYEAIREILQNAKDADDDGKPMSVRRSGETMIVTNMGACLDMNVWLMGHTSKDGNTEARGHFGEGIKLSMLAALRAGHKVKIINDHESWTPTLEVSDVFHGSKVLTISTHARQRHTGSFSVEIDGVDDDMWALVQERFLFLGETGATLKTAAANILLDPRQKGHLFVKGIWVEYKADSGNPYPGEWPADEARGYDDAPKWKSPIHMPRHASRIDPVVFPEGRDDFPGQGPSCNLRGLLTQRPSCHG